MKALLTCLLLGVVSTSYADCSVNSFGRLTDSMGAACSKYDSTYRRSDNNLYGNTPSNLNESYRSINGGSTWTPTTPPSNGLGVDTSVSAPNPYLNGSGGNTIKWHNINP